MMMVLMVSVENLCDYVISSKLNQDLLPLVMIECLVSVENQCDYVINSKPRHTTIIGDRFYGFSAANQCD